jgi:hypothetical protein
LAGYCPARFCLRLVRTEISLAFAPARPGQNPRRTGSTGSIYFLAAISRHGSSRLNCNCLDWCAEPETRRAPTRFSCGCVDWYGELSAPLQRNQPTKKQTQETA